jgi:membrane-associated protease RseP (regulator of RpoE activity)
LDDFELIKCTIIRPASNASLGLSLSTSVTTAKERSLSRDNEKLPCITSVEPDSPADQAGLRPGDLVLEINGVRTNGKSNKEISELIRSANVIEFTLSRDRSSAAAPSKSTTEQIRDTIRQIAADTINEKRVQEIFGGQSEQQLEPAGTPQPPQRRPSRKDSFNNNVNTNNQPDGSGSPSSIHKVYEEARMSSSRHFQNQQLQSGSAQSSPRSQRNKSEPAPPQRDQLDQNNQQTPSQQQQQQKSSPISRRSSSLYSLPADAPIVRLCKIRAYEEQLGFTVSGSKSNPGVFKVNDVQVNSPAANGGLRDQDYIIEISGQNIQSMNYNEVISLIKQKKHEDDLQLLVAEPKTVEWYRTKRIPISSSLVPKMQYIEALLKHDLDELNSQQNGHSVATNQTNSADLNNNLNNQCKFLA